MPKTMALARQIARQSRVAVRTTVKSLRLLLSPSFSFCTQQPTVFLWVHLRMGQDDQLERRLAREVRRQFSFIHIYTLFNFFFFSFSFIGRCTGTELCHGRLCRRIAGYQRKAPAQVYVAEEETPRLAPWNCNCFQARKKKRREEIAVEWMI